MGLSRKIVGAAACHRREGRSCLRVALASWLGIDLLGELPVGREGTLEVQRTCSESDPLHQWADAPWSSECALGRGDGQCCIYVSFTIWESKGDVYINSLHRVTSTRECRAMAHTGKGNMLLLPCLL